MEQFLFKMVMTWMPHVNEINNSNIPVFLHTIRQHFLAYYYFASLLLRILLQTVEPSFVVWVNEASWPACCGKRCGEVQRNRGDDVSFFSCFESPLEDEKRGRRTSLEAHLAAHAAFSLRVSTTLERMFEQSGPPDRHTWKSRNAAICANFCAVCAHCLTRGRSRMKVFHCCSHFWYPPALYSREGLDETDFCWRSKLF